MLALQSRLGREDKTGRDRCTGQGRMPLDVPGTCTSTGELGTPQNPPRYTQEGNLGKKIILGFAEAPEDEVFYFLWPG